MTGFDLDLTTLLGIWMAAAVLMVPLLALAIRVAVVPLLLAIAKVREGESGAGRDARTADRLARMEAELEELTRVVRRMDAEKAMNFEI